MIIDTNLIVVELKWYERLYQFIRVHIFRKETDLKVINTVDIKLETDAEHASMKGLAQRIMGVQYTPDVMEALGTTDVSQTSEKIKLFARQLEMYL